MPVPSSNKIPGKRYPKGLSLLETMISLVILTTAIILVVGIFLSGMKYSQKGQQKSVAVNLAHSILEEEFFNVQTGSSTVNSGDFFSSSLQEIRGQRQAFGNQYRYVITRSLILASDGTPIGNGLSDNGLAKVDIVVSWREERAGDESGLQRVGITKLVNQRVFQ